MLMDGHFNRAYRNVSRRLPGTESHDCKLRNRGTRQMPRAIK